MFIVLAIVLWRLINFRLFCSDCRSWPHEEKINNHGCWGKHAHIPENDYWGICFMLWYTRNIFLFQFSFFTAEYWWNRQIIIIGVPFRGIVFLLIEMKKLARLAVERNFWKHVLPVKVSGSIQASTLTFVRLSCTSENWRRTSRSCITVFWWDKWKNDCPTLWRLFYTKNVLLCHFYRL